MQYPRFMAAAALLTGGCSMNVSGVVLDSATESPIGGATLELRNSGWGFRAGDFVWDAEKISRAKTDPSGRFRFDVDGGYSVRVAAQGYKAVETTVCAHSPMIIRVGGRYADLVPDRRLLFEKQEGAEGRDPSSYVATLDDVVLRASGGAFAGKGTLQLATSGGIRFVPGTGTIPRPPPPPYGSLLELDLDSDCGWLFVSNGTSPVAAIQVRPLGWEQAPGQPRRWVMLFSSLAAR